MLLISVRCDYAVGILIMDVNAMARSTDWRIDVFALDRVSADSPPRLNHLTRVTSFFDTQSPLVVGWDSDRHRVE